MIPNNTNQRTRGRGLRVRVLDGSVLLFEGKSGQVARYLSNLIGAKVTPRDVKDWTTGVRPAPSDPARKRNHSKFAALASVTFEVAQ